MEVLRPPTAAVLKVAAALFLLLVLVVVVAALFLLLLVVVQAKFALVSFAFHLGINFKIAKLFILEHSHPRVIIGNLWRTASLRSAPHQQTPDPVYIVVDKLVHCDPNMYS